MDEDRGISAIVRSTKLGRGKRVLIMLAGLIVVAALIGEVVAGFRGRHISRNAAALTTPAASPAKGGWRPWWLLGSKLVLLIAGGWSLTGL